MTTQSKYFIIVTIYLSLLLCAFKVYALSGNEAEINYLNEAETQEIEKLIEKNMSLGGIPGLSVTIIKNDKVHYQRGFGYSDLDQQKPVDSQSLFELASNSKAFTALGILRLEEMGQITLDDQVTKYIPWLKVKYGGKETPLTIEQVMHQTSGINPGTIDLIPISSEDNALEETVRALIGTELDSKPGEIFQYATINYDILGLIIEKVTGLTFENYLDEFILNPLQLNSTYLFRGDQINDRMTNGYKTGFFKARLYEAPIYRGNKPAGYIISSGEDMGKWLKIQMDTMDQLNFNREIINKSHEASRTFDPIGNEVFYGGGWFLEPKGQISHSGMNPNYSSYIICSNRDHNKEKIGVAVLGNLSSNYIHNIALGIDGILHGQEFKENIPDSNQLLDKVAIGIIFILTILIFIFVFYIIKLVLEARKKERSFKSKKTKDNMCFIISFILMVGLTYSIYILPKILSYGGSWKTAFVWSPISIKVAVYLLFITIWIIYSYFILGNYFKKD